MGQFYWGTEETLVPVYQKMEEALQKHPDVTVVVNFASFRSVYSSVMEMLSYSDQIKTIAIIAEGVPESQTRMLNKVAHTKGVGLIGPATVGGIKVRQRYITPFVTRLFDVPHCKLKPKLLSCVARLLSYRKHRRNARQYRNVETLSSWLSRIRFEKWWNVQ